MRLENQFRFFKISFLLIAIFLIYKNYASFDFSVVSFITLASALLYLLSHFFRAFRLRFIISSAEFKTNDAAMVQFGSASIGNLLFPFAKDFLAVYLFYLNQNKDILKIFISLLYLRFFDFLVITPMLLILVVSGSLEKQGLALILLSIMFAVFVILILLPRLCKLVIDYLISFSHSKRALFTIKILTGLKDSYANMGLESFDKAFAVLLLTFFAWASELAAIYLISYFALKESFLSSYFFVLNNVLSNIPFIEKSTIPENLYQLPYLLFIIISLILLVSYKYKDKN